jgi:hypothetical protein
MLPTISAAEFRARTRREGNCRVWTGARWRNGYGAVSIGNFKQTGAHRAAWALKYGPIPTGLHVLHRCDNRPCVKITHLFLGTQKDNALDYAQKFGRTSFGRKVPADAPVKIVMSKGKKMIAAKAKKGTSAEEQLAKLLKKHDFDQLLKSGEVLDIEGARKPLGYSAWGLRRLCRKKKIDHIERFGQYYFLKSQVSAAFKFVSAQA